jgi:hypothetical protein
MRIVFLPSTKESSLVIEPPVSAKKVVPDWYKKIPAFDSKNPEFDSNNEVAKVTLKMCMPFFDATTGGYIQRTWTDIHIKRNDNSVSYTFAQKPTIMEARDKTSIPVTDNFYPIEFIWKNQWNARLPKGYSLLVTHPHNRLDLPFQTLSGIVDADSFYHTAIGNIPFYIQKGFEGFIPAGTPMYQLIPVKRDDWQSEVAEYDEKETFRLNHIMARKFYGAYRSMFWHKKNYN